MPLYGIRLMLLGCLLSVPCPTLGQESRPQPAQKQTRRAFQAPDTPLGRRLTQWLELLNHGDYEGLLAFHSVQSPLDAERRTLYDYRLYLMTRGFVPYRAEVSPSGQVQLLAQEAITGLWVTLRMQFSTQAPYTMLSVGMIPADPPTECVAHGQRSPQEIVRSIDKILHSMSKADTFSGAILIAHSGKPLYKRAFGFAKKGDEIPNRISTRFNLASMGKMFTGVAIMQLVQAGKLSLEAHVGEILPDYPNKEVAEKVTVRQLLTHTAGLGSDVFNSKFQEAGKERFRTVNDLLPLFANAPLEFTPGTRWAYSNAGFVLLGAILERVSGQSYFDYLKANLFQPAGMLDTDAYEMDRETPRLALGYTRRHARNRAELEVWQNNLFLHVVKGTPAGGCFSTVEDLFRFAQALRENRLLKREYTEMTLQGKVDTGRRGDRYAFGFQEEWRNGKRIVGHRGGFEGISTVLNIYPERDYTVIVLSNYDTVAQSLGFLLQQMILQE